MLVLKHEHLRQEDDVVNAGVASAGLKNGCLEDGGIEKAKKLHKQQICSACA